MAPFVCIPLSLLAFITLIALSHDQVLRASLFECFLPLYLALALLALVLLLLLASRLARFGSILRVYYDVTVGLARGCCCTGLHGRGTWASYALTCVALLGLLGTLITVQLKLSGRLDTLPWPLVTLPLWLALATPCCVALAGCGYAPDPTSRRLSDTDSVSSSFYRASTSLSMAGGGGGGRVYTTITRRVPDEGDGGGDSDAVSETGSESGSLAVSLSADELHAHSRSLQFNLIALSAPLLAFAVLLVWHLSVYRHALTLLHCFIPLWAVDAILILSALAAIASRCYTLGSALCCCCCCCCSCCSTSSSSDSSRASSECGWLDRRLLSALAALINLSALALGKLFLAAWSEGSYSDRPLTFVLLPWAIPLLSAFCVGAAQGWGQARQLWRNVRWEVDDLLGLQPGSDGARSFASSHRSSLEHEGELGTLSRPSSNPSSKPNSGKFARK